MYITDMQLYIESHSDQSSAPASNTTSHTPNPTHPPVRSGVVAEVWQEVVVELPEDVQGDASVGRGDSLVLLPEHGVPGVKGHVL